MVCLAFAGGSCDAFFPKSDAIALSTAVRVVVMGNAGKGRLPVLLVLVLVASLFSLVIASRGFEYISALSVYPYNDNQVIEYSGSITLPGENPKSFQDHQQQLWFYGAFGPSNHSLVGHTGIQAHIKDGQFKEIPGGPTWALHCLFLSEDDKKDSVLVPISTPSAYFHFAGKYNSQTSILKLFAIIRASEDPSQTVNLTVVVPYDQKKIGGPLEFEASAIMEAFQVLEDGCVSFPRGGSALFTDLSVHVENNKMEPTWIEQAGEDDYSPTSPCNITYTLLSQKQSAIMYSWYNN